MAIWAGIDLGTSGVKTILIDETQTVVAEATSALTVSRPTPGWSEQDPAEWWRAVTDTFDALKATAPAALSAVTGIGLSGQMHGATLLDAHDNVLRPAILWNDGRSGAECDLLEGRADFRGIGGNPVMPGFTAPKLEWVRREEPGIFDKVARVLLPKDYVRLLLTGEAVSEMSDSAGTLWLDIAARDWSEPLLAATGLDRSHMPRLVEGSEAGGALRADLRSRWGISAQAIVAGGGGDNAASAAGVGAIAPGTGFLSLGTSGVLFVATDRFRPNTAAAVHAFCHAVPDRWHQMAVMLAATDALNWLSRISGQPPEALSSAAETAPADHGISFLPYLSGERTPHNDPSPRGTFTGLSAATDAATMARAVMDGVSYAFADGKAALEAAGSEVGAVYALGGGARSRFWLESIADACNLTLLIPEKGDFGAAFGAARLAMIATGNGSPDTVLTAPPIADTVHPDATRGAHHSAALARHRALYPVLKALD